ncbi:MAG: hypothetical protein AAF597_20095 [Bacteroidota bacterium]
MIDQVNAQELLDRYFAGETSLDEEQQLRDYFAAGDIDPAHRPFAPMFAYWAAAGEVTAPPARPIVIRPRLRSLRWMLSAAAAVLLLLAVNAWCNQQTELSDSPSFPIAEATTPPSSPTKTIDWSKYEVSADEDGYRALRGALKTAATALNDSPSAVVRELDKMSAVLR